MADDVVASFPFVQQLKQSFQNALAYFFPMHFVNQLRKKMIGFRNTVKESYSFGNFDNILQKFNNYSNSAHSYVFGTSNLMPCSCAGTHGSCKYSIDNNANCECYTRKDIPECCVEPHILGGYVKPHQPYRYYLKILWMPTNETCNVWTHLLPAFYFIYLFYLYIQTNNLWQAWPLLIVSLSTIALMLFSAIAHLFHSRSSYHHCCWFLFDYFGITLYAYSSIISHFYASAELSYYNRIGWYNLPIFVLIGVTGFFCCCYSKTSADGTSNHRRWKIISNAAGYLYGMIPICHRLLTRETSDPAMHYHLLQFVFMLLSPVLYGASMPEKLWPGKFDIIGHSHQLFHVSIVMACYYDLQALYIDVGSEHWISLAQQSNYPTLNDVCLATLLLLIMCALVALKFVKEFELRFREELDGLRGRIRKKKKNSSEIKPCVDRKLK